jgi:hypothetical protein
MNTLNDKPKDKLNERIDILNTSVTKLAVSLDLYDELKQKKVSSHEEYLINKTKLSFLQKEILRTCSSISEITQKKEELVKKEI